MSCCGLIAYTSREAHNVCHAPARFPLPINAFSTFIHPRGSPCESRWNVKSMLTARGLHPPNFIAQVRWPAQL